MSGQTAPPRTPVRRLRLNIRIDIEEPLPMVTTRMTVSEVFDTSHTAADTDLIATYLLMVARANLKVGDHLEFPVPYKRQRQPKFAELAVLAVAHDSRRTMLVTANKSERDRAYLYQTTGKRDNLLSDNELDYINKSIGS